jgi:hypothetical protein
MPTVSTEKGGVGGYKRTKQTKVHLYSPAIQFKLKRNSLKISRDLQTALAAAEAVPGVADRTKAVGCFKG